MPSKRKVISPNQVDFFPRKRRPRQHNLRRNNSFAAFKKRTSPSPPTQQGEKPNPYAMLVPAWVQRCTSWIKKCMSSSSSSSIPEEDYMMTGTLTGYETRYRYDESKGRDVELWEEYPPWDSVEGRMVELGLS